MSLKCLISRFALIALTVLICGCNNSSSVKIEKLKPTDADNIEVQYLEGEFELESIFKVLSDKSYLIIYLDKDRVVQELTPSLGDLCIKIDVAKDQKCYAYINWTVCIDKTTRFVKNKYCSKITVHLHSYNEVKKL